MHKTAMPYVDPAARREASKRHYQRNRQTMIARAQEHSTLTRARVKDWLRGYLANNPCVDCGEDDLVVLEFDHRGDKKFAVGEAVTRKISLKAVMEEVAKCDVRCANCHRKKTYRERGLSHRSLTN